MIPLSLVTGFLGCGKTTFLRNIAARSAGRKIAFVVNEFSGADVDGKVLESDTERVMALPGGSIFCHCLAGEFVRVMRSLPLRYGNDLEGVVIEASGTANPLVIERMLVDSRLSRLYRIASVIAVADPGTLPTLLETLPNIAAQIEACDAVLLNKTDLFDETAIARAEAAIHAIRAGVKIVRTEHCAADIALFPERATRRLKGEVASSADPRYYSRYVLVKRNFDTVLLQIMLKNCSLAFYRVKGFVMMNGAVHYVDASRAGVTLVKAEDYSGMLGLAIIGHSEDRAKVDAICKAWEGEG